MLKKLICAGLILLSLGSLRAEAADTGDVLVWLSFGENPVTDGSLEVCRAGDPVPEGYLLEDAYGGGIIAGADVPSPSFALWMSEKAGPGEIYRPDRKGLVRIGGLEPGLYLIRQAEESCCYLPIKPFLVCVTEELVQVDTYPEILPRNDLPKTAQGVDAYLGALGLSLALSGLLYWFKFHPGTAR